MNTTVLSTTTSSNGMECESDENTLMDFDNDSNNKRKRRNNNHTQGQRTECTVIVIPQKEGNEARNNYHLWHQFYFACLLLYYNRESCGAIAHVTRIYYY